MLVLTGHFFESRPGEVLYNFLDMVSEILALQGVENITV